MTLEAMIGGPLFSGRQAEKEAALLPLLQELTEHHRAHCPGYAAIARLTAPAQAKTLGDIPYLPVTLFKYRTVRSISAEDVRVTVQSSGTGGAQSKIVLDAATAKLSSRALAQTLAHVTGGQRLPMLIIDTPSSIRGHDRIGARAAAILGLMPYGRDHVFALDDDLQIVPGAIEAFLAKYPDQPIFIYGFTFLIWQALLPACRAARYDLSRALLLHSGGWKKLLDQAVDNPSFRAALHEASGITRLHNFYGMAELPGVIFLEGADGLLYPPAFADVLIRDPVTRAVLPPGQPGLVQILNPLARSYPGHALLTEDMGVMQETELGRGLAILGRAPRAELRGCSDVLAGAQA